MPKSYKTLNERFDCKLKPVGECVEFCGARDPGGYGRFNAEGKMKAAHRFAWERERGQIEPGMVLDHLCRNRACVKLDHLRACTNQENLTAPGSLLNKTRPIKKTCPAGHSYAETAYVYRGRNQCRACHADRERKRRLSKS